MIGIGLIGIWDFWFSNAGFFFRFCAFDFWLWAFHFSKVVDWFKQHRKYSDLQAKVSKDSKIRSSITKWCPDLKIWSFGNFLQIRIWMMPLDFRAKNLPFCPKIKNVQEILNKQVPPEELRYLLNTDILPRIKTRMLMIDSRSVRAASRSIDSNRSVGLTVNSVTPHVLLIITQFVFSGWHLLGFLALRGGASPLIFALYRESIASVLMLLYVFYWWQDL